MRLARLAQRSDSSASAQVRQLSLDDALASAEAKSPDLDIARAVGHARRRAARQGAQPVPSADLTDQRGYTRTLKSQFQGLSFGSDSGGPPACSTFTPDPEWHRRTARLNLLEAALGCGAGSNPFGSLQNLGFGAANQWNLGLSLQQNVFTGGRVDRAVSRGERGHSASASIGLTAAKAQLTLDVTQAYYDALLADQLVTIADSSLSQTDTTLAQTQLGRQVGNASEFDLLRAQVTRDNQVPVLIQGARDRDVAYLRLKQLLIFRSTTPLALTTSLEDSTAVPTRHACRRCSHSSPTRRRRVARRCAQASEKRDRAEERRSTSRTRSEFRRSRSTSAFGRWRSVERLSVVVRLPRRTGRSAAR